MISNACSVSNVELWDADAINTFSCDYLATSFTPQFSPSHPVMCLGQKALRISRTPRTTRARLFANDIRIQTGTKTSIGDTTDHSEDDFGGCGWMDVPFVSSPAPRGVLMIRRFTIRILTSVASHKQTGVCYSGWWKQEKKKKKSSRSFGRVFQFIATFSPPVHRRHPRMALEWQ